MHYNLTLTPTNNCCMTVRVFLCMYHVCQYTTRTAAAVQTAVQMTIHHRGRIHFITLWKTVYMIPNTVRYSYNTQNMQYGSRLAVLHLENFLSVSSEYCLRQTVFVIQVHKKILTNDYNSKELDTDVQLCCYFFSTQTELK